MKNARRQKLYILLLAVLLLSLFAVSLLLGRYDVPAGQTVRILLSRILPLERTWTDQMEAAVLNIRFPRIILACLVGGALAAAGTAYQSVFRNPMAAPDILGASSGACFGAALAILLGKGPVTVTLFAFGFSILTVVLVCLVAKHTRGNKVVSILLAGIMVGSLFSAATSYVKLAADPADQLPAITYWLMGSLSGTKRGDLCFVLIPMLIGAVPLLLLRWRINLLTLEEEDAISMGIDTDRLRGVVIACSTVLTAASVSAAGMIGWVGLVVPHLCRRLMGNDNRFLLPASMLGGAAFLLLADDLSRNLLATEIPIGILTAFAGAPFFLYMMTRKEAGL